jgi:hypothetical protein
MLMNQGPRVKYVNVLHTTSQAIENGVELIHLSHRIPYHLLRCVVDEAYLVVCYPTMKIGFQISQLYCETVRSVGRLCGPYISLSLRKIILVER